MANLKRAEAPQAPAIDLGKYFPMPVGFPDLGAFAEMQRRNMEAMTAATQIVTQGMQAILRRQSELMRQAMDQYQILLSAAPDGSPEDKLTQQIDILKAAFEKNVAGSRELSDIASKVTSEAVDVLSGRYVESLDEIKTVLPGKAA